MNKWKTRLGSLLLALVMVVGILPQMTLQAHADYICPDCHEPADDYCLGCGRCDSCTEMCERCDEVCTECHSIFGGEECPECHRCFQDGTIGCPLCGRCEECCDMCDVCEDICVECHEMQGGPEYEQEAACPDCGRCKLDGRDYCMECGRCIDCVELCPSCGWACNDCHVAGGAGNNAADACPECGWCKLNDEFCIECGVCADCADICPDCEMCNDCSEENHCTECGNCYDYADQCDSGYEHCVECCAVCPDCGECYFDDPDYICEDCGLCIDCAESQDLHCTNCGACSEAEDFCEMCVLCVDCAIDDDKHCSTCGECFDGEVEQCECGEPYCVDCCPWDGPDADPDNAPCKTHSYNASGVCTVCGYKRKQAAPVITIQPRNLRGLETICVDHEEEDMQKETCQFTSHIRLADAAGATYQWQLGCWFPSKNAIEWRDVPDGKDVRIGDAKTGTFYRGNVEGAKADTLHASVPADACYEEWYVRCIVKNPYGTTTSNQARLYVSHVFLAEDPVYQDIYQHWYFLESNKNYHVLYCGSDGCGAYKADSVEAHTFGAMKEEDITKKPTETEEGWGYVRCTKCGYKQGKSIKKLCTSHTYPSSSDLARGRAKYTPGMVKVEIGHKVVGGRRIPLYKTVHGHGIGCTKCGEIKDGIGVKHTWGAWTVSKAATETEKGREKRTCTGCGYAEYRDSDVLPHTHDFIKGTANWAGYNDIQKYHTYNETHHWAICEDKVNNTLCGAKYNVKPHEFTPPRIVGQNVFTRSCSCGYVDFYLLDKALANGQYIFWITGGSFSVNGEGCYTCRLVKPGDRITVTADPAEPLRAGWYEDPYVIESADGEGTLVTSRGFFGTVAKTEDAKARQFSFQMPKYHLGLVPLTSYAPAKPCTGGCTKFEAIPSSESAATCMSCGYTGDMICTVCRLTTKRGDTTPALGHDYQVDGATVKLPTCESLGYSGDVICTHCGRRSEKGQTVPKLDHDYGDTKTLAAANLASGGKEGVVCTKCGAEKVEKTTSRITNVDHLIAGTIQEGRTVSINLAVFAADEGTKSVRGDQFSGYWTYTPASRAEPTVIWDDNTSVDLKEGMAGGTLQLKAFSTDSGATNGMTWTSPKVVIAANGEVVISKQPKDLTVRTGEDAVFTVVASGADLHYEWWGVDAGAPEKFGTDSATLTIQKVDSGWSGFRFWCKVTSGSKTVESEKGRLTVDAPAIVSTGVDPDAAGTAYASTQTVDIGGRKVELQAYALKDPETGFDTNYVKLRDVADALDGTKAQFNVDWSFDRGIFIANHKPYATRNGKENMTPFSGDRPYQAVTDPTDIDGVPVPLKAFMLFDDDEGAYTYYKLRDLGQALGFNVGWALDRGIFIEPGAAYRFDD